MKLINSDGLAFFGPGSERFWVMLQFLALAITFVAIFRQLRAQRALSSQGSPSRAAVHATRPSGPGQPRRHPFDFLDGVLLDADYQVVRAAVVPLDIVRARAKRIAYRP